MEDLVRTAEMNSTVGPPLLREGEHPDVLAYCDLENTFLRNNLPKETSLYDTVTLLAKLSVALFTIRWW